MKDSHGHTLLELLICMAVFICLASISIPHLAHLRQQMAERTTINSMLGALHYARSQAVTSRRNTSLCDGDLTCSNNSSWQTGLLVFADPNGNGQMDNGDTLLQKLTIPEDYSWRWSGFRSRTRISFANDGTTLALNGTFTLCHKTTPTRQIVVSVTGRPRVRPPKPEARCS